MKWNRFVRGLRFNRRLSNVSKQMEETFFKHEQNSCGGALKLLQKFRRAKNKWTSLSIFHPLMRLPRTCVNRNVGQPHENFCQKQKFEKECVDPRNALPPRTRIFISVPRVSYFQNTFVVRLCVVHTYWQKFPFSCVKEMRTFDFQFSTDFPVFLVKSFHPWYTSFLYRQSKVKSKEKL